MIKGSRSQSWLLVPIGFKNLTSYLTLIMVLREKNMVSISLTILVLCLLENVTLTQKAQRVCLHLRCEQLLQMVTMIHSVQVSLLHYQIQIKRNYIVMFANTWVFVKNGIWETCLTLKLCVMHTSQEKFGMWVILQKQTIFVVRLFVKVQTTFRMQMKITKFTKHGYTILYQKILPKKN